MCKCSKWDVVNVHYWISHMNYSDMNSCRIVITLHTGTDRYVLYFWRQRHSLFISRRNIAGVVKFRLNYRVEARTEWLKMEDNDLWLLQRYKNKKQNCKGAVELPACLCRRGRAATSARSACCSSVLSVRLVISLEDRAPPLICKTPTLCQTHLGIISFPFHSAPLCSAAVNISELHFQSVLL